MDLVQIEAKFGELKTWVAEHLAGAEAVIVPDMHALLDEAKAKAHEFVAKLEAASTPPA